MELAAAVGLRDANVFVGQGGTPGLKRSKATKKYGAGRMAPEDVILLYDNTVGHAVNVWKTGRRASLPHPYFSHVRFSLQVFGSATDGFCMTANHFGFNNMVRGAAGAVDV